MMRTGLALVALFFSVAMGNAPAIAATGSVSGRVTDEQGRAVTGARIGITGNGAVGIHQTSTDAEGFYRFPAVPLREKLKIRAEAPGSAPVIYQGVLARDGTGTRRDFLLRTTGSRSWLVVLNPRIPYHSDAKDAIVAELRPMPRVLNLSGDEGDDARLLREAAAALPSAVLAIGDDAARLARRWVKDVPVVYTMVVDPATADLATANLCGVRLNAGFDEQVGALLAARPGARTVGTIYDPRTLAGVLGDLRDAAARRGLSVVARPARSPGDVPDALRSLGTEPLDAFLLLLDPLLIDASAFEAIRRFTSERSLIFVVPDRSLVAGGGTFSYAPGFAQMGSQAAQLAELIVRGALDPGLIGAIYPTTRYIALNPIEAKRLGIPLSPESLLPSSPEADKVDGPSVKRVETP